MLYNGTCLTCNAPENPLDGASNRCSGWRRPSSAAFSEAIIVFQAYPIARYGECCTMQLLEQNIQNPNDVLLLSSQVLVLAQGSATPSGLLRLPYTCTRNSTYAPTYRAPRFIRCRVFADVNPHVHTAIHLRSQLTRIGYASAPQVQPTRLNFGHGCIDSCQLWKTNVVYA